MPVPDPRNAIRIARGNYADLLASQASILEGEICYATDQDTYYQKEGGALVKAAASAAEGALAVSALQSGDNVSELVNDAGYVTALDIGGGSAEILYVDSVLGNDGTAVPGDITKPYLTIKAACAAAGAGHIVRVSAGSYTEANPIVVPAGVLVTSQVGDSGWVGDAVLVAPSDQNNDLFQLSASSAVNGMTLQLPAGLGAAAVSYAGAAATTASVTNVGILGTTGGQGTGISVRSTSSGKIIAFEIRYKGGQLTSLLEVTGGILATESVHIPNVAGTNSIVNAVYQSNALGSPVSRYQGVDNNCGNNNVSYMYTNNGGTAVFYGINFFNGNRGIRLQNNSYNVSVFGGLLESVNEVLEVEPGVTGSNGKLYIDASITKGFLVGDPTWYASDYAIEFRVDKDDNESTLGSKQFWGQSVVVGNKETPEGLIAGSGGPFSDKVKVFAASGATNTTDGTGFVDHSASAVTKNPAETFSFKSTAANEVLYFATTSRDKTNELIKHYGMQVIQLSGDSRDATYAVEIWNGTNWVEVNKQAVSREKGYNYADEIFWRSGSFEALWYGIRSSDQWTAKTVNGVTAYWSRVRIAQSPTTAPVFIQWLAVPAGGFAINPSGAQFYFGTGQYRYSLQQGGNVFSSTGGVTNGSQQIGTGPNQWTHTLLNSVMNGNGDQIYWQVRMPEGTCTAFDLELDVIYTIQAGFDATTKPTMSAGIGSLAVVGVPIADPNGGIVPVERTQALAYTTIAENPDAKTVQLTGDTQNYIYKVTFGPFRMFDHYEGDMLAITVALDDDGSSNADVAIWGVDLRGYRWTPGERQEL